MNVSIPQVGHLISIYALGVCAGAFSLILMHKYRPKHILLFLASLITLGAAIAAIALKDAGGQEFCLEQHHRQTRYDKRRYVRRHQ